MTKCYICEKGNLNKGKVDYKLHGVNLGKFDAEICDRCGETFFDEETSRKMTKTAKEEGLWKLEAETSVTQSGNSLAIRIPRKIAQFLNLRKGTLTRMHPEEDKLIIETLKDS
ncbi:AbrB/MazE/SpoVT family DNA-binding domain-containing protein [Candidatus Woesearchaeota archaeon]|nr:AbrB/MazE/SpoVT family DNA-binding domain-containing protein [Candidatus Woesearchaeota archaeon]